MLQVQQNVFSSTMTFPRWTWRMRRALANARLRFVESERRRLEAVPAPLERGAALAHAHGLQTLCVKEARLSNLVSELAGGELRKAPWRRTAGTN